MSRRVEPPLVVGEAEAPDDVEAESPLEVGVEVVLQKRVVDTSCLADLLDQRAQVLLQTVEDLAHLGGLHPGLVVVQEDVVGLVGGVEALDVAVLQLQVLLEVRQHRRVVGLLLRRPPVGDRERAGPPHLPGELGRHAHRLLVVPARDSEQARLVAVVVDALLELLQVLEQRAELGVDEALVGEPPDRG